jgi:head-tail adaptor
MVEPVLSRRLVLEEVIGTSDGAGGIVRTWSTMGVLWAQVRAGSGREKAADFVTLSSMSYRITVRAAPPGAPSRPKPEQRFRDGARIFRILAVGEAGSDGRYLTCFAQEELAA